VPIERPENTPHTRPAAVLEHGFVRQVPMTRLRRDARGYVTDRLAQRAPILKAVLGTFLVVHDEVQRDARLVGPPRRRHSLARTNEIAFHAPPRPRRTPRLALGVIRSSTHGRMPRTERHAEVCPPRSSNGTTVGPSQLRSRGIDDVGHARLLDPVGPPSGRSLRPSREREPPSAAGRHAPLGRPVPPAG
jgi:hypothetical protein